LRKRRRKTIKIREERRFFSLRGDGGLEFLATFGYDDGAQVSNGETRDSFLENGTKK
jgi:hypothetical protein